MEKICKKCGNEFKPQKGLVNYCSLQCRNSRERSAEVKKRIGDAVKKSDTYKKSVERRMKDPKGYIPHDTLEKKRKLLRDNPDLIKQIQEKRFEKRKKKILESDFSSLKFDNRRDRIIFEQENKCNKCGLDTWNDQPIPLELEHKDGNNKNNKRSNLEMLCPNCHAQTDTWRGRNINMNKNRYKITDEQLLEKLIEFDWNMRQTLIFYNLSPKGGNYNRCHKLKREYDEFINEI